MRKIKYTFLPIENCNMCGANESRFKILGKRLNQSQGMRPCRKFGITTTIVKCKNCGLIFSNPQPIPPSIKDHYELPAEQYLGEEYFIMDENYFSSAIY